MNKDVRPCIVTHVGPPKRLGGARELELQTSKALWNKHYHSDYNVLIGEWDNKWLNSRTRSQV